MSRERLSIRITVLALLLSPFPLLAADVTTTFETIKVADGIYAFIAPEPKSGLVNGNSVAIIGDDGVLVVDSGHIPSLTRRMLAQIRSQTDKPVRYVVNTHWHWDHNLANFVYAEAFPGVTILSTAFTRQSLLDYTPRMLNAFRSSGDQALVKMRERRDTTKNDEDRANLTDDLDDLERGLPELRSARFVPPNETFDSAITVYLGQREVRIFCPGRANTAGDAVVYVPDAKVLITGDIVVAPTPYATTSYLKEWISVLNKLSAMDLAAIVPGHGPVQRDRTYLAALTALLDSVVSQVHTAVQSGLSLEETQKKVDLTAFQKQFAGEDRRRNRAFNEWFRYSAIETAWKQEHGENVSEAPF